jgi:hypothetical protein
LAGHEVIAMTIGHYSHVNDADLREGMEKVWRAAKASAG